MDTYYYYYYYYYYLNYYYQLMGNTNQLSGWLPSIQRVT